MAMTEPLVDDALDVQNSTTAQSRTYVQRLTLQYFRNYDWLALELDAVPVMLTGPNGAGKTNILEAISLLTPGKGMRGAALEDMDQQSNNGSPLEGERARANASHAAQAVRGRSLGHGRTPPHDSSADAGILDSPAPPSGGSTNVPLHWQVAADIHGPQGPMHLGTGHRVTPEGDHKRAVRIDGEDAGQQRLAACTSVIWLTPPMEQLFIGPSASRRKFFDRLTYSFTPTHASMVNRYEQAMRERNKLLQFGPRDDAWFAAIEQKMAEYGVAVAAARIDCAEKLNGALQAGDGDFPRGWLAIDGALEHWVQDSTALEAEAAYTQALEKARDGDGRTGRTSIGPHRSDLLVEYAPKKQPARVCSTGEQKALMLSIILSVARARRVWMQTAPIVLLDEVVAHLDPARRDALFEVIEALGVQAWMTGTDPESFSGIQHVARHLVVENGSVIA